MTEVPPPEHPPFVTAPVFPRSEATPRAHGWRYAPPPLNLIVNVPVPPLTYTMMSVEVRCGAYALRVAPAGVGADITKAQWAVWDANQTAIRMGGDGEKRPLTNLTFNQAMETAEQEVTRLERQRIAIAEVRQQLGDG